MALLALLEKAGEVKKNTLHFEIPFDLKIARQHKLEFATTEVGWGELWWGNRAFYGSIQRRSHDCDMGPLLPSAPHFSIPSLNAIVALKYRDENVSVLFVLNLFRERPASGY